MKLRLDRQLATTTLLLAPALLLAAVISNELGWGRGPGWELKQQLADRARLPQRQNSAAPKVTLQPEFGLASLDQAYTEVAERPLFVPTRRASPSVPGQGPSSLQKGQFTLTGVLLTNGKNIALLRENATGKMLRVEEGTQVNGMQVEKLEPQKLIFKQGQEREEVILKIPPPSKTPLPTTQVPPVVIPGLTPGSAGQPLSTVPPAPPRPRS